MAGFGAEPESRYELWVWLWIPGSLAALAPRNDEIFLKDEVFSNFVMALSLNPSSRRRA
jgi:hypothetical protein